MNINIMTEIMLTGVLPGESRGGIQCGGEEQQPAGRSRGDP